MISQIAGTVEEVVAASREPLIASSGAEPVVRFAPLASPRLDDGLVDTNACYFVNQHGKRGGDIALEILVGLEILVDQPVLHRMLVQRDNPTGRAPARGRIPWRSASDEHDQISGFKMLKGAHTEPERVVVGKICTARTRAPDDGNRQRLGKSHQRGERLRIDPGMLGDDDGVARIARALAPAGRCVPPSAPSWAPPAPAPRSRSAAPILKHVLHGHVQVHRPLRRPHGHFACANNAMIERDGAGNAAGPFDERRDQLV